jgi:lactam utilization protein B
MLTRIVSFPTIIISYCTNAIEAIEGKRIGLKQQLDILGDEKYNAEGSEEAKEFQTAKKLAVYDLEKMIKEAKANSAKATAIKVKLTSVCNEVVFADVKRPC